MRVLITGGTGFLGRNTARRLQADGHEVAVLGRNQKIGAELAREGLTFIAADLTDAEATAQSCRGRDVVIHSGALASPWGRYEDFYSANVVGTKNIVDGAIAHGARRFINISTPSLYFDYRHRFGIKESDPLPQKQVTYYGATKLLADQETERAARAGLFTIAIRPRAIFGPGDTVVLGRLLRLAEKGTVPLVNGGRSHVDMTYIDNVVESLRLCLSAPESCRGKTYNITNGQPMPAKQAYDLLFERLGRKVKYRSVPFFALYALASAAESAHVLFRRPGEPALTKYVVGLMSKSQTLDISLARAELGYSPQVTMEDGLSRYAEWWRFHSDAQRQRATS